MGIKVKLFADFREKAGEASVEIDVDTVGKLLTELAAKKERLGESILESVEPEVTIGDGVTVLVNRRNVRSLGGMNTELEDGDTVAIFPPIGGG